jgi:ELWxxDGT repeat protein
VEHPPRPARAPLARRGRFVTGSRGAALWETDGTPEGTFAVPAGGELRNPSQILAAAGAVYCVAEDEHRNLVLWRTDGAAAGTAMLRTFFPLHLYEEPFRLVPFGEYSVTVTDTATGLARRYFNALGQLASVGDTMAFGPKGAASTGVPVAGAPVAGAATG